MTKHLLGLLLLAAWSTGAIAAKYTVYSSTANVSESTQEWGTLYAFDPSTYYDRSTNAVRSFSAYGPGSVARHDIFHFTIDNDDIPAGENILGATFQIDVSWSYASSGSAEVYEILLPSGTIASTTGIYKPTWRYRHSGTSTEWTGFGSVANPAKTDQLSLPEVNPTPIATYSFAASDKNIKAGIISHASIPATMPTGSFEFSVLVIPPTSGASGGAFIYNNSYLSSGSSRVVIETDGGATATPTPTVTATWTSTPTPGATNTPTPTPQFADEFGDRADNAEVISHARLNLEDGLAVVDNAETDPTNARTVIDRNGNFDQSLKNYISNGDFPSAVTGWTVNANGTVAYNAASIDDVDNSGALAVTATADDAVAELTVDFKAGRAEDLVFSGWVKGTANQVATVKLSTDSNTFSKEITLSSTNWESFYLIASLASTEDATGVSIHLPTSGDSLLVDNLGLFRSEVGLPFVPDYLLAGDAASFSSVTIPTFTQGSVVFVGSGGALAEDNAGIFYDDTSDELGLGTTSPAGVLDVQGNAYLGDGVSANTVTIRGDSAGSEGAEITLTGSTGNDSVTLDRSGNDIRVASNSASTNVFSVFNSGAGSFDLSVQGNIFGDEYLYHYGDADTYFRFLDDQIVGVAGGLQLLDLRETTQDSVGIGYTGQDVDLEVRSAADDYSLFVRGSDGKVGLGTNSPNENLTIDVANGSGNPAVELLSNGASTWVLELNDSTNDFSISPSTTPDDTFVIEGDGSGDVGLGTSSPAAPLHIALDAGTIPAFTGSTGMVLSNNDTSTDDAIFSLIGGNGSGGTCQINFGDQDDEDGNYLQFDQGNNRWIWVTANSTSAIWATTLFQWRYPQEFNYLNEDKDFAINGDTNDNLFYVDATTGSEYVGILTGAPEARLHVVGAQGTNPTYSSIAVFENTASTGSFASICIASGISAESTVKFGDQLDEDVGMIRYDHSTAMEFVVETNQVFDLESDGDTYSYYGTKYRDDGIQAFTGAGTKTIDTADETFINFTVAIGSTGSINLNQGEAGQFIILYCSFAGATLTITDDAANSDAGNVRLAGDWSPTADDTLVLVCDGTDWIELSRSTN